MTFLLNEQSVHGQFATARQFHASLEAVMQIRRLIHQSGHDLKCHDSLKHAQVTPSENMQQVIHSMSRDKRRAWTAWVGKTGPFWHEDREHAPEDWVLARDGSSLTNTAVGEAAFCVANRLERQLVSFAPSDWMDDLLSATYVASLEDLRVVEIRNHTRESTVRVSLEALPVTFDSWASLETHVRKTCPNLFFQKDAFANLRPHPYHQGAAERVDVLLKILETLSTGFTATGQWTEESKRLLDMHFSGAKSWFSDSSTTEKSRFANALTFPHPTNPGEKVVCPWHGKVKSPQLRIHFSWPIVRETPVYIPYVGPKLTKC